MNNLLLNASIKEQKKLLKNTSPNPKTSFLPKAHQVSKKICLPLETSQCKIQVLFIRNWFIRN